MKSSLHLAVTLLLACHAFAAPVTASTKRGVALVEVDEKDAVANPDAYAYYLTNWGSEDEFEKDPKHWSDARDKRGIAVVEVDEKDAVANPDAYAYYLTNWGSEDEFEKDPSHWSS
jgi:hypothetical protein